MKRFILICAVFAMLAMPVSAAVRAKPSPCWTSPAVIDLNWDGKVNIADFTIFSLSFEKMPDDPEYVTQADLNCDGRVDEADFDIFRIFYIAANTELPGLRTETR